MNTLDYYNNNAQNYFNQTVNADMSKQYEMFLKYVHSGKILDFGCGSGRDTLYFKNLGFDVDAVDGSKELCLLASKYSGINVRCMDFKDLNEKCVYDGIWACSSILHVNKNDLLDILIKMRDALKDDGYIYTSIKNGEGEEIDNVGRYYNYLSREEFESLARCASLESILFYSSKSVSNQNETKYWNSFILKKM